jgi:hypothetical protein
VDVRASGVSRSPLATLAKAAILHLALHSAGDALLSLGRMASQERNLELKAVDPDPA